ncbi:hypothetical protein A1sIIB106_06325 [Candidatus Planktophila lacus]|uniref:hypothetical protein n=1 Tax=Candidatus Planktophila lacus TaxID=1884913 RepID=UPI000BAC894C|nr:hypothetical protein [Candidatus Planktophila lacus]ASY25595.1 hypothetical protein A1sIIB106_06325 [Candidatus Planktophila lacus]ASY29557.1 hypothetical protein A1sIIB60_06415 [Candidatus Planktophila lacus]
MTPPKKPDWIEIAENDGGLNQPAPKAKKSGPVLIAATALVLTFGGAVVAQTNQGGTGDTQQPQLVQASQSATMATPALSAVTPQSTSPNLSSSVQSPSIKAPSIGKNTLPAIATPPNMNGGDDDDEDEDEDEDEGDDEDDDDRDDH